MIYVFSGSKVYSQYDCEKLALFGRYETVKEAKAAIKDSSVYWYMSWMLDTDRRCTLDAKGRKTTIRIEIGQNMIHSLLTGKPCDGSHFIGIV